MSNIRIDGLDIKYKFKPAGSVNSTTGVPHYGVSATAEKRPFRSIIIHHTAGGDLSSNLRTAFNYLRKDSQGGGFYAGYHFLVGKDGAIWQTAPEEVRTNHSRAEKLASGQAAQRRSPFNNRAAIGVGFVGSGFYNPQGIQRENGLKLIAGLMKKYGINENMIKPHHETDNKSHEEGDWINAAIKSGELARYQKGSGSTSGAAAFGGAAFLVAIILGGIYGWRRFIKPRLERAKAERLLKDRQNRVTVTKFRAANKARIEAAKYNPVLADQLQKELNVLLK